MVRACHFHGQHQATSFMASSVITAFPAIEKVFHILSHNLLLPPAAFKIYNIGNPR